MNANKSKTISVTDIGMSSNANVPVFGYLTTGKQLLMVLLDIQTNQRVSFQKEKTYSEKTKDTLKNIFKTNPIASSAFVIGVANLLTKLLVESGVPVPHIKNVVYYMINALFGPVAASMITVWLPDANPTVSSPSTSSSIPDLASNFTDSLNSTSSSPLNSTSSSRPLNSTSSDNLTNISQFLSNSTNPRVNSTKTRVEFGGRVKPTKKRKIKVNKYKITKKRRNNKK
jgi:hypothetical protein